MERAAIGMLLATGMLVACLSPRGEGSATSGGAGSTSGGATTTGGGNSGGGTNATGSSSGGTTATGSSGGSASGSGSGGGTSSGGSGGATSGGTTTGGNDGGCETAKACGMACCSDTTDCQIASSGAQVCSDRCDDAATCGPAAPCCEILNPSGADAGGHCLPYDCGNECCLDTITKCTAYCQHLGDCVNQVLGCDTLCNGLITDAGAPCPDLSLAFDCIIALSCADLLSQDQAYSDCVNKANCPDAG